MRGQTRLQLFFHGRLVNNYFLLEATRRQSLAGSDTSTISFAGSDTSTISCWERHVDNLLLGQTHRQIFWQGLTSRQFFLLGQASKSTFFCWDTVTLTIFCWDRHVNVFIAAVTDYSLTIIYCRDRILIDNYLLLGHSRIDYYFLLGFSSWGAHTPPHRGKP